MTQNGNSPELSPYDLFAASTRPTVEVYRLPGEAIVEQAHAEHPEIEERPYQIECLGTLAGLRRRGEQRALIHMATGLGKTTVAALDVKDFLQKKPNARVLFVSHQNEILRQARLRFEYILGDDATYGMFTGEERKDEDADCVFASFQLLHTQRETFAPEDFDYIVVDESHHGKATTYEPSLQYFEPKFLLGMTATPDRRDLKEIREIFGDEVYSKPLAEALSERLLARPDYRVILDDIDELLLKDKGIGIGKLNRTLFIPKRDEEIASIIAEKTAHIERPKTIVFCPSIEHADRMAELLPDARALHSERSQNDRRSALDHFINNGIPTLTTVDVFNEGVDVADANVIVFLRSTESETIFQQQLGRGLRKTPGKNSVLVLDFVASCDRLVMIDNLLGQYAQDEESLEGEMKEDLLYDLDFGLTANELDIASLEFKETTRHILEVIKGIRLKTENMKQPAPEDWVSINAAAVELGWHPNMVMKRVHKLGIVATRYLTPKGFPGAHINLSDMPALKQYGMAPDGLMTFDDAAKELGISKNSVRTRLSYLALSAVEAVLPGTHLHRKFVNEEDIEKIREYGVKPDDLSTLKQAADLLRVTTATLNIHIEKRGVAMQTHLGGNGRPTKYLTQEAIEALKEVTEVPEGSTSVAEAAEQLGVDQQTIFARAKKLDVEVGKLIGGTSGGGTKPILSDEDFAKIKEASIPPDGWVSYDDAAKELGIGRNTFATRVDELGIIPRRFMTKKGPAPVHISSEDFDRIAKQYIVPDGWVSLNEIADELGLPIATIIGRANRLELNKERYMRTGGRPRPHVSAEDAEKIRQFKPRK